jgi:hypothetical protein
MLAAGHHGALLSIGRFVGLEHAANGVLEQCIEILALGCRQIPGPTSAMRARLA